MKINLAENMLRFGVKNLNESNIRHIQLLTEATNNTIVNINYTQLIQLRAGDANPASYIDAMVNGIMDKISKDPEGSKMLSSNSLGLKSITITGGSSNVWSSITSYDTEQNGTKVKPSGNQAQITGYNNNLNLARTRAENCKNALLPRLQQKGVKGTDSVTAQVSAVVYNTGGRVNNNFQRVTVTLELMYVKKITTNSGTEIEITGAKPLVDNKIIMTGAYLTSTKMSTGKPSRAWNDETTFKRSTGLIQNKSLLQNPNRLIAFDVKWNVNVMGPAWETPLYRYLFIYASDGTIKTIEGKFIDEAKNKAKNDLVSLVFQNNPNIPATDEVLKTVMGADRYKLSVMDINTPAAGATPKTGTNPTGTTIKK